MHARYFIVGALALGSVAVFAPACAATVESSDTDTGAGGANMTPNAPEDTGETAEAITYCECSVKSDFCPLTVGGHCVAGFNSCIKSPSRGCGFLGAYPCVGWCVRR